MKRIAVIGATGLLGQPVTKQLLNAGFEVSILSRNPKKAAAHFPNIPIHYADLNDKESLSKALAGQEIVHLNLHISPHTKRSDFIAETDGLINFLEVAKKVGIKRISYLSSILKDYCHEQHSPWWVFKAKQKAIQLIKGGGIPYTIFHSSAFMENLDKPGGFRRANRLSLVGRSSVKLRWISANDYGKQVCKSFELLTDENREYFIQGPEGYTTEEAFNIFTQYYTRRKLKIVRIPMYMLFLGAKLSFKLNYIYRLLSAKNNFEENFKAQQTWDELGKPTETLECYAKRAQIP